VIDKMAEGKQIPSGGGRIDSHPRLAPAIFNGLDCLVVLAGNDLATELGSPVFLDDSGHGLGAEAIGQLDVDKRV
jgi:hypothetical protein